MMELDVRKRMEEVRQLKRTGGSLSKTGIVAFVAALVLPVAILPVASSLSETGEQFDVVTKIVWSAMMGFALLAGMAIGQGIHFKAKARDLEIELDDWKEFREGDSSPPPPLVR